MFIVVYLKKYFCSYQIFKVVFIDNYLIIGIVKQKVCLILSFT